MRLAAGFLVLACLLGCGFGGTVKPPESASFSTRITPGGLKFFVYQWGSLDGSDLRAARRAKRSDEPVPEGYVPPVRYVVDHRASFMSALEAKLRETGYCREGYYELNSHFIPGESRIRGECKDLATPQDRERFGNSGGQAPG